MNAEAPKNEEERQECAFKITIGQLVLERDSDVISYLSNFELLRRLFKDGWSWGKMERGDPCPACYSPTALHDDE